MDKKVVYIKDMHCKSCEIIIEENLKEIGNVKDVSVSHKSGECIVFYDGEEIAHSIIEETIIKSGYGLSETKTTKDWGNKNPKVWKHFFIGLVGLGLLYAISRQLGLDYLRNINIGGSTGFTGMLMLGLFAGFSTCMAVVGGLLLALSSERSIRGKTLRERRLYQGSFHIGRLLGFWVLGGLLGLLGSVFHISNMGYAILFVLIGLIIFFSGLSLTEISPRLSSYGLGYPKWISRFFLRFFGKFGGQIEAFSSGVLTFFLPCGWTMAVQALAIASGNFLSGSMIMLAFALGTLPGLLGIGGLTTFLRGERGKLIFRCLGVLLLLFGIYNLYLGGYYFYTTSNLIYGYDSSDNIYEIVREQEVYITQDARGYHPNVVSVPVGTRINLIVDSLNQYSCASAFSVPSKDIAKLLDSGPNRFVIDADRIGRIPFGCTMGMMYRGYIDVIDG